MSESESSDEWWHDVLPQAATKKAKLEVTLGCCFFIPKGFQDHLKTSPVWGIPEKRVPLK